MQWWFFVGTTAAACAFFFWMVTPFAQTTKDYRCPPIEPCTSTQPLNPLGKDWCKVPTMHRGCEGTVPYPEWSGFSWEKGEFPPTQRVQPNAAAGAWPTYTLDPARCDMDPAAAKSFNAVYSSGKWVRPRNGLYPKEHYYTYSRGERFMSNVANRATGRDSMSGGGSKLGTQTSAALLLLARLIKRENITTMFDIPCGDTNWVHEAWETDSLELYVGGDVSSLVTDLNRERFAHHANKQFITLDLGACPIPKLRLKASSRSKPFDLIHCRDALQHMSLEQGSVAAKNILSSGAKFAVSTTYDMPSNAGVVPVDGAFFRNDLSKPPYNFPKPILCVKTDPHFSPGSGDDDDTCIYDLRPLSASAAELGDV